VNILNTEGKVIMNIMGNLIVHSFQTISMDVAGLSSGTYIVQIIAEGNRLVNKKIIKK
jgi:hypothetical protein